MVVPSITTCRSLSLWGMVKEERTPTPPEPKMVLGGILMGFFILSSVKDRGKGSRMTEENSVLKPGIWSVRADLEPTPGWV